MGKLFLKENNKMIYLVFILLLIAYFLFVFLKIKYIVAKANLIDPKQPDGVAGTGPALSYLAAGDSTAVGLGASSYPKTYTYQLFQELSKSNKVSYKNIAVSGAKTQDLIDKQLTQIIQQNPDVITISIGANDLNHLVASNKILDNYKTIVDALTNQTHAKIYITSIAALKNAKILPWWYRHLIDLRAGSLNKEIAKLESDRVKIINIREFGWDRYPDIQATFAADHFHPSDLGYQNWRDAFLDKILKKD
jgi:acyl-CoA thioesterase-1